MREFRRLGHSGGMRLLSAIAVMSAVLVLTGCPVVVPPTDGEEPEPATLAPGLLIEVVGVTFPDDGQPEVVFELLDGEGNRIALSELTDARFILGFLNSPTDGSTSRYESYTVIGAAANYDPARLDGVSRNSDGTYTYKFATVLPASFDPTVAHQLAGQFERLYPVDGLEYPYNLVYPFLPDTGTQAVARREFVTTESCNQCHTRLEIHGGARREVQLCIMCHNEQSIDPDTGNSVDFAEMIHKIHRGADLPSVQQGEPYQIIGFRNSVHDYSDVHMPQSVSNCAVCHADAPAGDVHLEQPTLAGCNSCHDRTWMGNPNETPDGYTNHTGGQQVDNSLCSQCHKPEAPAPAPILEAHLAPTATEVAPGLALEITDVIATTKQEGGAQVAINFVATDKDGLPITDLSVLDIVAATIAYPATEYETFVRETIQASFGSPPGMLTANANGSFTYVFGAEIPEMDVTYAVAMEGRRNFDYQGESITQGTATNGQMLFTLNGSEPQERRQIVDVEKCNACHGEVRLHGELRIGLELCVMCHNPNTTDISRRPEEALPPETVNFKDMIHAIHAGEDLEGDYTVYGFGGTAHDFTEVRFPGHLQECSICHIEGTYDVPISGDALSTVIVDGEDAVVEEKLPERAACTSCHDGIMANVHALIETDFEQGVESCAVCHGADSAFAVDVIHALAP